MDIREQFKRAVIESIHGLPYEEAIKKEEGVTWHDGNNIALRISKRPITIGRVMQALNKQNIAGLGYRPFYPNSIQFELSGILIAAWKLTNEDGGECTDDDQDIETIEAILNLLS
jgi:hypothetical protein